VPFTNSDVSFGQSGLVGENVTNPTAIDFSKTYQPVLFVTQQDGTIWRFEIDRTGFNDPAEYEVTASNSISWIQDNVQNYNDDGNVNSPSSDR